MVATGLLATASCSDFNDYNEAPVDAVAAANKTLWQNIVDQPNLSDFASLVRQAGFETKLDSPRTFTVWAPLNGSFNVADYQSLSKADLLQRFVMNHIADFSYVATGDLDKRVHTLNNKSYWFRGNGTYTFDNYNISTPNVASTNGLLHLLDGAAEFYPNIHEYVLAPQTEDTLLSQYFQKYEYSYLDTEQSVKGPLVDGIQTYLDEVYVNYNSLANQLGARLENEDSTYTVLFPTDDAFKNFYDRIAPLYNYITTTKAQSIAGWKTVDGKGDDGATAVPDASWELKNVPDMKDRMVRYAMIRNLIYNNNNRYNRYLVDETAENLDTLLSVTNKKLSNPDELTVSHLVGEPIELSNGYVRVVDSLAFYSWETFNPELDYNPASYLTNKFAATVENRTVPDTLITKVFGEDTEFTSYAYSVVKPSGARNTPTMFISLPDVKSTTYNVYAVYLPSAWPELGNNPLPNILNFELSYCKANGQLDSYRFSKPNADAFLSTGKMPAQPNKVDMTTGFINDPTKTDTLFIGQFTFPVCYHGLKAEIDNETGLLKPRTINGDTEVAPNIKITSPMSGFNSTHMATYSREVRLAAIILKPVELDDYEKQK